MDKGRKNIAVETDIVNLLKQLRAIWTILDMKLNLSEKEVMQVKKDTRHTLKLYSDPKDSQADEPSLKRKITSSRIDSSRIEAEKTTEREKFATKDPARSLIGLRSIQRHLSVADEQPNDTFYPQEEKEQPNVAFYPQEKKEQPNINFHPQEEKDWDITLKLT